MLLCCRGQIQEGDWTRNVWVIRGPESGSSKKQNMYLVLGAKGISRVERKWKNGATCVTAVESFMYGLYPKEMLWLYEAGTGRQEGRSEWQSEVM